MNTKGTLIAILALGSITFTNAQQPTGYFFKEFTSGKVLLKFISEIIFKRQATTCQRVHWNRKGQDRKPQRYAKSLETVSIKRGVRKVKYPPKVLCLTFGECPFQTPLLYGNYTLFSSTRFISWRLLQCRIISQCILINKPKQTGCFCCSMFQYIFITC